ncbi:MAG: T9SS type A sorting domain-containing protein [Sphingobacteriaceae bacterium]|nr:T9SS type A sorting domain-containing protein [Sphingobacteriaceae bacterium]
MKKLILSLLLIANYSTTVFSQNTCATAIALTQASIPFNSGAQTTCGKVNDYGVGAGACNTSYGGGEDFVYSLNITTAPMAYNFSMGGAGNWKIMQIFTGCPSPVGAPTNCLGNMVTGAGTTVSGNFVFPTNGTYYIVIDTWPNPTCGTFTLGINPMPTCPAGLGAGVTSITLPYASGPGTTCGSGNNLLQTSFAKPCGNANWFTGEDAVWTFTPAAPGTIEISFNSTGTWPGMFLYEGCPFSGSTTCVGFVQNNVGNVGLSACVKAGVDYYLIVDSWNPPICNPYSNLLITSPTLTPATNDYCSNPIPLSSGGTFSGTTNAMSADQPGNLPTTFCGSVENNQWFSFVATAATATFGFSGIGGSNCPAGVQAQVFDITKSSSVCPGACTSFTNKSSPCYNPATLAAGTLTATGLTVGNTYYLMVDGNAGSQCTFNVAGWTNPVLPVDLIYFKGWNIEKGINELEWFVAQEVNFDYYIVQRSLDGSYFTDIGQIKGSPSSKNEKTYNFYDKSYLQTLNYYRLKLVDKDGTYRYSDLIAVNTDKTNKFKVNKIFPNPTSSQLYMSVDAPTDTEVEYQVLDISGRVVAENKQAVSMGTTLLNVNLESLSEGIYYMRFVCGNETKVEKFSVQ